MSENDPSTGNDAVARQVAADGAVCGAPPSSDVRDLGSARDEIDRLRGALAAGAARERALSDELQHRVRNLLAMIRSIARQTWEEGASQQDYAQHLQGRLDAIARYHAHLGIGTASGIDLEDIVRDELLPTNLLDGPWCRISGPPVRLYGKQAELLGLAIHELAVNAIKFGALAQRGGLIVEWSLQNPRLHFHWSETGVAVASSAPRPIGFGRRLIENALPYQLGATTSFDLKPGGVVCSIEFALAAADAAPMTHPGAVAGALPRSPDKAGTPL